jgi:NADH:ubiquinone oxidoreductase subunit 6 (subunit J)
MCKKVTLKNIVFALVTIVWFAVFVLIPFSISFNPNFTQTNATLDMIRNLDNACITISSIILAAILAIMTILITKDPKLSGDQFLDISSIPFFAIVCSLFSLYLTYFDFNNAKLLLALSMEFTIGGIFALYFILTFKREKNFPNAIGKQDESKSFT